MKTYNVAFLSVVLVTLYFFAGCNADKAAPKELPASVTEAMAKTFDMNDPAFIEAKRELDQEVELCGPGVVKGVTGENKCAYQIEVDSLFIRHPGMKTGLLHDEDWAQRGEATWVMAPEVNVPDNFDIRDLMKNGQPELKTQQCGDCWAWATHHGLELARAVHDETVFDHSVQTVLSCSKQGSCSGGYMSAVDFMKNGLPLEKDFPYLGGVTGRCKFNKEELVAGWSPKVMATPYIGSSLDYSRSMKTKEGFDARPTVQQMKAAMYQWKSPLVVTVNAYSISGDGVVNSCSAINSGGNHMVTIVGWEKWNGKDVAHVWNSWGKGHGKNGVSRIVWECGAGKLNRGLGVSAKIVQYKPACAAPMVDLGKAKHTIFHGTSIKLGIKAMAGQICQWLPTSGVDNPKACETFISPSASTEYHLKVTNDCGSASAMTLVEVWGPKGTAISDAIFTPTGFIKGGK